MTGKVYSVWLYTMLVGFILLQQNDAHTCTIRGTWVDSSFRGKKVGDLLIRHVLLDTEDQDTIVNVTKGAEGFYERYGFNKIGHRDDFDMDIYIWKL